MNKMILILATLFASCAPNYINVETEPDRIDQLTFKQANLISSRAIKEGCQAKFKTYKTLAGSFGQFVIVTRVWDEFTLTCGEATATASLKTTFGKGY